MKNKEKSILENIPPAWLKLTIYLKLDLENYKGVIANLALRLESGFTINHMYFARYTDVNSSTAEITVFTSATPEVLRRFCLRTNGVTKVTCENRGTGSLAHAYAFQMVKYLSSFSEDIADDKGFLDVIHWACNMRGLDYLREARLFAYRATSIVHNIALESDKNLEVMREFNSRVRERSARDRLTTRLNLMAEKVPSKAVDRNSALGPPPKPRARADAHKGRAAQAKKSARSAHR